MGLNYNKTKWRITLINIALKEFSNASCRRLEGAINLHIYYAKIKSMEFTNIFGIICISSVIYLSVQMKTINAVNSKARLCKRK